MSTLEFPLSFIQPSTCLELVLLLLLSSSAFFLLFLLLLLLLAVLKAEAVRSFANSLQKLYLILTEYVNTSSPSLQGTKFSVPSESEQPNPLSQPSRTNAGAGIIVVGSHYYSAQLDGQWSLCDISVHPRTNSSYVTSSVSFRHS